MRHNLDTEINFDSVCVPYNNSSNPIQSLVNMIAKLINKNSDKT